MTHLFKRGKFWQITYKKDGKRYWRSLGLKTKRAAEVARARIEIELAQGKSPQVVGLSLKRLIVHYLRYCEVHNAPSTLYTKKIYVRRFLKFFDDAITSITRADVEKYLRRPAGTPTLNRELATLRHLFNFAVEWDKLEKNPASGVKFLREEPRLAKILTDEQLGVWFAWLENNDPLLYDICTIALHTGLRRGDILKIKGGNIGNRLTVLVAKTNTKRSLPLNNTLREVLLRRKKQYSDGYIFPFGNGHLQRFDRSFRTAKLATGLDFWFKDFRDNFATRVIAAGADARTAQVLLAHADIRTTQKYFIMVDELQDEAVKRLEDFKWGK